MCNGSGVSTSFVFPLSTQVLGYWTNYVKLRKYKQDVCFKDKYLNILSLHNKILKYTVVTSLLVLIKFHICKPNGMSVCSFQTLSVDCPEPGE